MDTILFVDWKARKVRVEKIIWTINECLWKFTYFLDQDFIKGHLDAKIMPNAWLAALGHKQHSTQNYNQPRFEWSEIFLQPTHKVRSEKMSFYRKEIRGKYERSYSLHRTNDLAKDIKMMSDGYFDLKMLHVYHKDKKLQSLLHHHTYNRSTYCTKFVVSFWF